MGQEDTGTNQLVAFRKKIIWISGGDFFNGLRPVPVRRFSFPVWHFSCNTDDHRPCHNCPPKQHLWASNAPDKAQNYASLVNGDVVQLLCWHSLCALRSSRKSCQVHSKYLKCIELAIATDLAIRYAWSICSLAKAWSNQHARRSSSTILSLSETTYIAALT